MDFNKLWKKEFYDIVKVLEMGANKYELDGWLDKDGACTSHKEMHSSLFRHIAYSSAGIRIDEESGLDHLLHAAARCVMLYTRIKLGIAFLQIPKIPGYFINIHGEIEDSHGVRKSTSIGDTGYRFVSLFGKRYAVHRLVALVFYGPAPAGYYVNHKDADKLNNHKDNLEYCTPFENFRHAMELGLVTHDHCRGENSTFAKLSQKEVDEIREAVGYKQKELAARYNVHQSTISRIINNKTFEVK